MFFDKLFLSHEEGDAIPMETLGDMPPFPMETTVKKDSVKPEEENIKVFVYGSLMEGLHNHGLLSRSTLHGGYVTVNRFKMVDWGSFPACFDPLPVEVSHRSLPSQKMRSLSKFRPVLGEMYTVTPRVLNHLDTLEGNGSFYTRREVKIKHESSGKEETAWMYVCGSRHQTLDSEILAVVNDNGQYCWDSTYLTYDSRHY